MFITFRAQKADLKFWEALGKPWTIAYLGNAMLNLRNLSVYS